jgi:hypothetical protein
MDYEDLLYMSRIESAKESITRVRLAFLVNLLASFTLMLGVWNGYFSWYRFFVLYDKCPNCSATSPLKIAQDQIIKSWVDSLIVTISPLGIRFGISDASFVGPIGLLILVVLFLYCARRENHAVGYLLIDTKNQPIGLKEAIFFAISSHMVFLPIGNSDRAIAGVEPIEENLEHRGSFYRSGFNILVFFPAIAVLTILAVDISSVFLLSAPFRLQHPVLWYGLTRHEKMQFMFMEVIPLSVGLIVLWTCNRVRNYSSATAAALRCYRETFKGVASKDEGYILAKTDETD